MTGESLCLVLQARIKKIMQTDEEIGKVAAAVPVIICILWGGIMHPRVLLCIWVWSMHVDVP